MARIRISKILPFLLVILLTGYFTLNIKVFWPKISRLIGFSEAKASIVHIVDGDTILVEENEELKTIRFIGYDAPELSIGDQPPQCFAQETIDQLNDYFQTDRTIILESDDQVGDKDKYGRYLRYISLPDGTDIIQDLIRQGYGKEMKVQEYSRHSDYKQAEQEAEVDEKGIWQPGICSPSA